MSSIPSFDKDWAFRTMKELCAIGPRVVGSTNEREAAKLVEQRLQSSGIQDTEIAVYPFRYYDGLEAKISTLNGDHIISGVPCWMSASTPDSGITAETIYLGSHHAISDISDKSVKNKIVFVIMQQQYLQEVLDAWNTLYDMSPAGVVFLDLERNEAPRAYHYQQMDSLFSRIPSVTASAKQARSIHNLMFGSKLRMTVRGQQKNGKIHNAQARLQGKSDKTIVLCAHHDTVPFTSGATDNAAGVAIVLEIARALTHMTPHFTYQIATFGGEELEMQGSQRFLKHKNLEDVILCFNFDSIGELPGVVLALAAGHDDMIEWLTEVTKSNRYPARCRRVATSGGDNIPFTAMGIPTVHFACMGTTSGKVSHTAIDTAENLTPWSLHEVGTLALRVLDALESAKSLPFKIEVPEDLRDAAKKRLGM